MTRRLRDVRRAIRILACIWLALGSSALAAPEISPEVDAQIFVSGRGPDPQVTNGAQLVTTPSAIGPIIAIQDLSQGGPINGKSGGGGVLNVDIAEGKLKVASCASAETGTGENFIGDGNAFAQYRDTIDVTSATLADGTVVPVTFAYVVVMTSHAVHTFGQIPSAHHARASAQLQVDVATSAPTQNVYGEVDSFTKYSYASANPTADGAFAAPGTTVVVQLNALVGGTITLELYIESDSSSDVNFVDNDGLGSLSATLLWAMDSTAEADLTSRFTLTPPQPTSELDQIAAGETPLPFPDPFALPAVPSIQPALLLLLTAILVGLAAVPSRRVALWRGSPTIDRAIRRARLRR